MSQSGRKIYQNFKSPPQLRYIYFIYIFICIYMHVYICSANEPSTFEKNQLIYFYCISALETTEIIKTKTINKNNI